MHSAPAVSYPVGPSRRAAVLHLAVAGAGLLASAGWLAHFAAADSASAAVVLCAAAGMALGLQSWRCLSVRRQLQWDGAAWSLADAQGRHLQGEATLAVVMDLGRLMLARCTPVAGRATWLWLDGDADRLRWRALRRAAFDPGSLPADAPIGRTELMG